MSFLSFAELYIFFFTIVCTLAVHSLVKKKNVMLWRICVTTPQINGCLSNEKLMMATRVYKNNNLMHLILYSNIKHRLK